MTGRLCSALLLCLVVTLQPALAQNIETVVAADSSQIFVSGHQLHFDELATAHGEPITRIDDTGFTSMLSLLSAKLDWQPGTRFIAITRADGTLVTFTVGSNAATVGGSSVGISTAPFYHDNRLYLPLLPLAAALGLTDHRFAGGHAFVPQILSAQRRVGQRRTILEIHASAPLTWRTAYGAKADKATLTLQFPGFANSATQRIWLGGRDARLALVSESGPPGFPITTINIDVKKGVHFASHRMPGGAALDLILARDPNDLRMNAVTAASSVQLSPQPAARPTIVPSTPAPASPTPQQPVPTAQPIPAGQSASPLPSGSLQPGDTPEPEGASSLSPGPQASPSPSEAPLQKISDVFVSDSPGASRITLVVSGPVSFEWHRLGDPDNRFWVDIQPAALIGPARDLTVKLPFIQSIKVSQHELMPNHVVRVSIDPSQAIDVRIGAVEGSPNQLGLEILASPPQPDAPTSGLGMLNAVERPTHVATVTRRPTQPNLIVIDPGHGGNDPGAINRGVGLVESHVTLAISQRLKSDLEHSGWHVQLTRDGDYEVGDPAGDDRQELQSRCDVANAAGARLFVSVHVNSSFSSSPNGVTTYYWKPADRGYAQMIENDVVQATGIADAGVHRENFYVIHHTFMPAILVETAYLSNPHDASLLAQASFMNRMADSIARGIQDFTGGPPAQ